VAAVLDLQRRRLLGRMYRIVDGFGFQPVPFRGHSGRRHRRRRRRGSRCRRGRRGVPEVSVRQLVKVHRLLLLLLVLLLLVLLVVLVVLVVRRRRVSAVLLVRRLLVVVSVNGRSRRRGDARLHLRWPGGRYTRRRLRFELHPVLEFALHHVIVVQPAVGPHHGGFLVPAPNTHI